MSVCYTGAIPYVVGRGSMLVVALKECTLGKQLIS